MIAASSSQAGLASFVTRPKYYIDQFGERVTVLPDAEVEQ